MRRPTARERALSYLRKHPGIRHMELVKALTKGSHASGICMDYALVTVRALVTDECAQAVPCGSISGRRWRALYLTDAGLAEYKRLYGKRMGPTWKRLSIQYKRDHRDKLARDQAIAHAQAIAAAEAEMEKMGNSAISADLYRDAFAVDSPDSSMPASAETDPLIWIKEAKPNIQSKSDGLVAFEPWDYQEHIIKMVVRGRGFVIPKSRQTGVTTAIMVAYAWLLIYGRPFHGHAIANKEGVVIEQCLRKTRLALRTAQLTADQRERLHLGGEGSTEYRFTGKFSHNYLKGHAASKDAGHSCPGTHVLMDECARMPFTETIYTGLSAMLDQEGSFLGIVSTFNGEGDFFCNAVDNAEEMGLEKFEVTWKAHPHRDQAWYDRTRAKAVAANDLEGFMEQHELFRKGSGEQVFDVTAIERLAATIPHLGPGYQNGHRYSIGIDQSAKGGNHIACVIDMSERPRQVVEMRVFKPKRQSRNEANFVSVTDQRIAFNEQVASEYPGSVFIDGTTEKALVAKCKKIERKRLKAVHSTDSQASRAREDYDEGDRLHWLYISRKLLLSWGVATADMGRCVIHTDQFPDLFTGLKTAKPCGTNKNLGKCVDHLDAYLHAAIPLRRERKKRKKREREERIPASPELASIVGKRW